MSRRKLGLFKDYSYDQGVIESKGYDIKTLEDTLKESEVDLDNWEVSSYNIEKVNDKDGDIFNIKVYLSKRKEKEVDGLVAYFKQCMAGIQAPRYFKDIKSKGKYLFEISIPDLHLGKLVWGKETRSPDYDSKQAVIIYKNAVNSLINKIDRTQVKTFLLPIGNDFFNVDNNLRQTTGGTPQEEDGRWQKTFKQGCNLMVDTIDRLCSIAPTDVVLVQGNHDSQRSQYLASYLKAWYRNNPNVTINDEPQSRKYYIFGNTLLGFTHGNEEKCVDLPMIMATEMKRVWSNMKYAEWHLGHLHTEIVKEHKGVKIRHLPSLTSTDAWHSHKGYIGNIRQAQGMMYHPSEGLIAHYYHNI
jgi:hypothetical protein